MHTLQEQANLLTSVLGMIVDKAGGEVVINGTKEYEGKPIGVQIVVDSTKDKITVLIAHSGGNFVPTPPAPDKKM
jgi:hypothetical protein